jgi:hypothetical protein
MMDAYVLGAVRPYNTLLGGKLLACLVRSREIYNDFTRGYGDTTGTSREERKRLGCCQSPNLLEGPSALYAPQTEPASDEGSFLQLGTGGLCTGRSRRASGQVPTDTATVWREFIGVPS